jgi:uncharacterized phage protein (TIGR01671 family)
MREIKFRAWNDVAKEMYYLGEPTWNDEYDLLAFSGMSAPCQDKLMQFTGLKDKNGKEIYEGDIVKMKYVGDIESVEEIKWDTGGFVSVLKDNIENRILDKDYEHCEVIGNVWENPELLNNK